MRMKRLTGLLGIFCVSGVLAGQGNAGNPIIPPQAHYQGKTYAEWSAVWWQWLIPIPTDASQYPFNDQYGPECGNGANSGNVWFLVGFFAPPNNPTVRNCQVPVGTALFFPVYNTECSTVESDPFHLDLTNPSQCVDSFFNGVFQSIENIRLTIDHQPIVLNWDNYLIASDIFGFALPNPLANPPKDNNNLGVLSNACTTNPDGSPNPDRCQAKSKGYWIMLPPLSNGKHTISFYAERIRTNGAIKNPVNTVYNITVVNNGVVKKNETK